MTNPTLARIAELTGESVDDVECWVQSGLLDVDETEAELLERLRIVGLLRRRGFDVGALAAATQTQPGLLDRYVSLFAPKGRLYTVAEVAERHGLDPGVVHRFWQASGAVDQGELGDEQDRAAIAALSVAAQAGLPLDGLIQMMRVYADASARVAEAESRLFHFHVHERLRAEGVTGDELAELTDAGINRLLPLVEPALAYFHRKALGRAVREDLTLHLAQDAGLAAGGDTSGRVPLAVAFVDLSQFTSMTEAMGDLAAAEVLDRFSELVRRDVLTAGGRVVKQIGDEFMLVFPDAATALPATLDIRHAAAREPAFLATRIGVHYGSVLCREGDYIGATVNMAARITGQATAHQVLVSEAVREQAGSLANMEYSAVGAPTLKGIDERIELFEVHRRGEQAEAMSIDPVCGMRVNDNSAPARLLLGESEILFCSRACLRRYVGDQGTTPST